jgi:hypothetical protein
MASGERDESASAAPMPVRRAIAAILSASVLGLFIALIGLSLNLAGVINVALAYAPLVLAWLVGFGAFIASEFVWVRPPRHRLLLAATAGVLLAIILGLLGWFEYTNWNFDHTTRDDLTASFEFDDLMHVSDILTVRYYIANKSANGVLVRWISLVQTKHYRGGSAADIAEQAAECRSQPVIVLGEASQSVSNQQKDGKNLYAFTAPRPIDIAVSGEQLKARSFSISPRSSVEVLVHYKLSPMDWMNFASTALCPNVDVLSSVGESVSMTCPGLMASLADLGPVDGFNQHQPAGKTDDG